jgi:pyruvate dehydrogenase E2 component (dihydrolipoamide acetyltransferase)
MDTVTMASAIELRVPDIGDFSDVPVIELMVKPGDVVRLEDSVATLESEKATLDVPANVAGRVLTLEVTRGSRVSKGTLLMTLEPMGSTTPIEAPVAAPLTESPRASVNPSAPSSRSDSEPLTPIGNELPRAPVSNMRIYASPSVRRIGRDLGVDLNGVEGSGRGGRITAEDVRRFVRERLSQPDSVVETLKVANTLPASTVDFAKYGEIARKPLSRIRRISAATLARNWATIPHVTNFDSADITDLEQFRKSLLQERTDGLKVTLLSFLVRASAATLRAMPAFNASLDGEQVVLKQYVHIGVAVDTHDGLLVPVLRNADQLGVIAIASALAQKADLARNGKLKAAEMEGGCFTISSLGGIGGSGFTPIINAPELAILGVGKARLEPRWNGNEFLPRLILPLCLSWDHRALDGVAAARFLVHLVGALEDFRRVSL